MPPNTPSSPSLDDVFDGSSTSINVIVDADIIEAVKENIQPLQKGRRATALSAIFSTPHAQRDTILARKKTWFRLQVVQALEDTEEEEDAADPLDVYSRFVAWTLESYPQGQSAESGLLELLEEATRKLKDRALYKQDPRYLKLWTLYAGYIDKPALIYAYLLANDIGTDLGQLYEDYALVLERDGRRREADDIYQLGIARKAEPFEHLKKRHADFQLRMLSGPLVAPPSPPRPAGPPTVGRRTVLGENVSRTRPAPTTSTSDVFTAPQPNARLQIFVDPTGEKAEGNEWADLGTRGSRMKENEPKVHKMGSGPLSRHRGSQRSVSGPVSRIAPMRDPPARTAFVPFRDDDNTFAMPPPSTEPSRRIASTLRIEPYRSMEPPATPRLTFMPYRDEPEGVNETPGRATIVSTPTSLAPRVKHSVISEAEALRRDPFKNYDVHPDNS